VINADAPAAFPEISEVTTYATADLKYNPQVELLQVDTVRPLNIENSFPPDAPFQETPGVFLIFCAGHRH
jgi:hypothetical protein